jgi:hypothetical protein
MTSLITFESTFRERLLDLVYSQWHDLGAPFSNVARNPTEVIDPEALLWGAFEFAPTEPRLFEAVTEWLRENGDSVIRQRLKKHATAEDPRTGVWNMLDKKQFPVSEQPSQLLHGLETPDEFAAFVKRATAYIQRASSSNSRIGRMATGGSTILLRARGLLGSDVRQFLLLYLLANDRGGKLRTIRDWSCHTYRSVSQAATRWEAAGVVVVEHGFCYLTQPEPWRALLQHRSGCITIVDWFKVFDACIRLLRTLAQARRKGFSLENPVVSALRRETYAVLSSPLIGGLPGNAPSIASLRDLLPQEDTARAIA